MINKDRNLFLQPPQNIVAVTSGIGSMGKTWLSITLAHALNTLKQNVLLFDADNGILNVETQLELKNETSLSDVLTGKATLNQAVEPINRRKFDVISAAAGSNILADTSIGRLHLLKDDLLILSENYDYTLVDLPAEDKVTNHLLPQGSEIILVCTDSPSNIVSTYMFLQNFARTDKYKNLQIVVNYAHSYEDGMQTYNTLRRACEKYLIKTPSLLGVIRWDTRVRDAIRNHVLTLNRYPSSEAAEDVLQIARKILQKKDKTDA